MPYARPIKAPGSIASTSLPRQGAAGGANNQGTRGGPGRGGVAARPVPTLNGPPAGGGVSPVVPGGGKDLMASVQALKDNPTFQAQVLQGADPQQAVQPAGGDLSVASGPAKPAWQQLQELGVGGQGSAAANQAKLEELKAAKGLPAGAEPGGAGPAVEPGVPGQVSQGGPPSGPFAKPFQPNPAGGQPGAGQGFSGFFGGGNDMVRQRLKQGLRARRMPGQIPSGGGPTALPMPGQIPNETPGAPQAGRPGMGRAALPLRPQMLE